MSAHCRVADLLPTAIPHPPRHWAALRALERLAWPVIEASDEAAAMDAGFDAGEWSGPAHGRMLDDELDRLAMLVGWRFQVPFQDLLWMLHWHGEITADCNVRFINLQEVQ